MAPSDESSDTSTIPFRSCGRTKQLVWIVSTLCCVGVAETVSPACDGESERRIGMVLGEPVFADALKGRTRKELWRVFVEPVWQQWLEENRVAIAPTAQEAEVFRDDLMKRRRRELRGRIAAVDRFLEEGTLSEKQETALKLRRDRLQGELSESIDASTVSFLLRHWKTQRLLYQRYGGGRVVLEQLGYDAVDAGTQWLKEQLKQERIVIDDAQLRGILLEPVSVPEHHLVPEHEVNGRFLKPSWLSDARDKLP